MNYLLYEYGYPMIIEHKIAVRKPCKGDIFERNYFSNSSTKGAVKNGFPKYLEL